MSIVDIYGDLQNDSEIIIGAGNFNQIHGLLTDKLIIDKLDSINIKSIPKFILSYKILNRKLYFSLYNRATSMYLYINNNKYPILSATPQYMDIEFSCISHRNTEIFAGTLYSVKFNNKIISWPVANFSSTELIMFLPTTWYENIDGTVQKLDSFHLLLQKIKLNYFKGYTNKYWCESVPNVEYCRYKDSCSNCFGSCPQKQYCSYDKNFKCEYDDTNQQSVTFASDTSSSSSTIIFWIVFVIILFLIFVGLIFAWFV